MKILIDTYIQWPSFSNHCIYFYSTVLLKSTILFVFVWKKFFIKWFKERSNSFFIFFLSYARFFCVNQYWNMLQSFDNVENATMQLKIIYVIFLNSWTFASLKYKVAQVFVIMPWIKLMFVFLLLNLDKVPTLKVKAKWIKLFCQMECLVGHFGKKANLLKEDLLKIATFFARSTYRKSFIYVQIASILWIQSTS